MFWHAVTRLGEIQIILPAALIAIWPALKKPDTRIFALRWLSALAVAIALTTATKLAFIGWGIGSGALNFTGISGHAMMSASVYPLLLALLASNGAQPLQKVAFACGTVLALLVGVSRLQVQAHSVSEVAAALILGAAVTSFTVWHRPLPQRATGLVCQALVLAWVLLSSMSAPPIRTHILVTRLSLTLAGHDKPHTRAELLRPVHHTP